MESAMKQRSPRSQNSLKKLVIGAAMTSSLIHASAATESFLLPISPEKLECYYELINEINKQGKLPEITNNDYRLPSPGGQIIALLSDQIYKTGIIELDDLILNYTPGDEPKAALIMKKNRKLLAYLKKQYPDAVSTLQEYYLNYLRDSGYLDRRSYLKAQGHAVEDNEGLGELMPATYANANVKTIANAYTVVNAAVWANAIAVTMAVAAAAAVAVAAVAVIGGPIFQYETGRQ